MIGMIRDIIKEYWKPWSLGVITGSIVRYVNTGSVW